MSTQREVRKERQVGEEDPVNFTCGGCRAVVPFHGTYECPRCGYGKDPKEEVV